MTNQTMMIDINHSDYCSLLFGTRLLFLSDLLSLQGTCESRTGEELNLIVTGTSAEDKTITVEIVERDREETLSISHGFLQDAVWLLTPRVTALVEAARKARDAFRESDPRAAIAEIRAEQEAEAARQRIRDNQVILAAWFESFDQDPKNVLVNAEIMLVAACLRDRITPRDQKEAGFLASQCRRADDYGLRVKLSPKQSAWMCDILSRSRQDLLKPLE